jgi:hypothetical protein
MGFLVLKLKLLEERTEAMFCFTIIRRFMKLLNYGQKNQLSTLFKKMKNINKGLNCYKTNSLMVKVQGLIVS